MFVNAAADYDDESTKTIINGRPFFDIDDEYNDNVDDGKDGLRL